VISLEEALHRIDATVRVLPPVLRPLDQALGTTLAESVACDADSPPHDMALVDGYALCAVDAQSLDGRLRVIEEVVAGETPRLTVAAGVATRIMTGAPVPPGADAVVMVEQASSVDGPWVRLANREVKVGQNILRRGTLAARGSCAVAQGTELRPVELALLAQVGRSRVLVHPFPRVGVLVTGSELVPVDDVPAAGKIRNSNGPMLAALVRRAGGEADSLGIAGDEAELLRHAIEPALEADILVLSGGVSAGVKDLVPAVLESMGIRPVFHRVRLRPGKPVLCGVMEDGDRQVVVFGLPGNPVSSYVCFELFVRHAMRRMAGFPARPPERVRAQLTAPLSHRGETVAFLPARIDESTWPPLAEILAWHGSADLPSLSRANGLVELPAGERRFVAGDDVAVLRL
jgi:molybdopterin molybdotransferase